MLRGERVLLRARHESDVPILEDGLYNDVPTRSRADSRSWRPKPPGTTNLTPHEATEHEAVFSVLTLDDDELAGEAVLWGIDTHHRMAHIGMSLLPEFRGRGLATDVVRVLCGYGFDVLGLHRMQVDTLTDNAGMIGAAKRAGFGVEGTLRGCAWANGAFHDGVVLGLLVDEWRASG